MIPRAAVSFPGPDKRSLSDLAVGRLRKSSDVWLIGLAARMRIAAAWCSGWATILSIQ